MRESISLSPLSWQNSASVPLDIYSYIFLMHSTMDFLSESLSFHFVPRTAQACLNFSWSAFSRGSRLFLMVAYSSSVNPQAAASSNRLMSRAMLAFPVSRDSFSSPAVIPGFALSIASIFIDF